MLCYFKEKIYVTPRIGDELEAKCRKVFKDEIPRDRIPIPTGDNRYTQNTIPGYSGKLKKHFFQIQVISLK